LTSSLRFATDLDLNVLLTNLANPFPFAFAFAFFLASLSCRDADTCSSDGVRTSSFSDGEADSVRAGLADDGEVVDGDERSCRRRWWMEWWCGYGGWRGDRAVE
jgi:hypothetical protein